MTKSKSIIPKDEVKRQKQFSKSTALLARYLKNCKKIERIAIQNRGIMESIKRYERQFKTQEKVEL